MKISAKYRAAAVFSAAFVLMSALAAANFAGSYNNAVTAEETSVTSATEGTSETAETEYGIAPMAYDDVYMPESEGDTYLIDLSKITIDADTVETGTQLVMSECITMSVREKNIHVMEEYGINSVYIRIVTAIRSGFKVNLSGIPQVVGGHSYSDITIHLIIENEGEITDFSCENSYARESSVSISLNNYGTISGGTYDCSVDNEEGGVIIGGNFSKTVTNHGTISDGNFNNGSYWVLNYGTVSGGTFQSYVLSQSSDGGISGGNFKDAIIFEHYEGYVTGGDFRNVSEVIWYGGSVTGGIFNESVKDVLPADSSCVFYNESEKTYTVQGDVTLDETFELNEGETLVIPDGAKVNNLEELSEQLKGKVINETHIHDDIVFKPWTETDSLPTESGNYYLTEDMEMSGDWTVPTGAKIDLCLNGNSIRNAEIIVPTGAELNIYDCSKISENVGSIGAENNENSVAITNNGTVNIYGGYILGLKNAIINEESGILNISFDADIYAHLNGYLNTGIINKGTMTMKNGMVDGSATAIENSGTLTLENVTVYCTGISEDPEVSGFTPENAIVNTDTGTLTISGGSIGYAPEEIIFSSVYGIDNQGTLDLAGDVKFYTTTANIKTTKPINITGELTNTDPYIIDMSTPGVFAAGEFAAQAADKFTPSSELANEGYEVVVTENNELAIDYRHYTYGDEIALTAQKIKPPPPEKESLRPGIAVISLPMLISDSDDITLTVNGTTVKNMTVEKPDSTYYISIEISQENGFKIGENTIKANFTGEYYYLASLNDSGNDTIKVIVDPKSISAKFDGEITKFYDGTTACTAKITSDGFVEGDKVSITATSCKFDSANAGARTVTASGLKITGEQSNFYKLENDEITGSGKITPKLLDIPAKEYTYDGKISREIELDGVNGEKVTAALTAFSKNAGTYTYDVTSSSGKYTAGLSSTNYSINKAGTLTINKRLAKIEWQNETSFVYDGTEKSVAAEVTNAVDGDTFNIEYDGNKETNVGKYTAEILSLGNDNYTLDGNTSLEWKISAAVSESTNAEINYKNETISTNSKMEYSFDGETYFPCAENMSVTEFDWDGSKSVTVMFRYAADQNHSVGAVQTVVIPKRPTAPDISGMAVTKTQNSITVAEIAGCEYSIDGTAWQDSGTFTGLKANTKYTIQIRTKATESTFKSFAAEKSVITSETSSGTTKLKTGETVETENGSITNDGNKVEIKDNDGNKTTTVTLSDSGEVTVDESGNVKVPDGSVVETGEATVTLPDGGKVSLDGTITADELQVGDVTVKGKSSTFDTDGNISMPNGGIISKDGAEKIISGGAVIDTEGNVIGNSGDLPVISAAAADGGDMSGIFEGSIESITLQIKISEIDDTDIELPESDIKHIYDISLIRNGEAVQPVNGKKIKITLYVPDDLDYPAIFRMENDGSFTDMNAEYDSSEKVISFVTIHLSNYVLAEKKQALPPEEPDNTDVPAEAAPAIPSHGIGMPPAVIGSTDSGEDVSSAAGTFSDENVIRTEGKGAAVWIFAVIIAAAAVTIIVRKTKQ